MRTQWKYTNPQGEELDEPDEIVPEDEGKVIHVVEQASTVTPEALQQKVKLSTTDKFRDSYDQFVHGEKRSKKKEKQPREAKAEKPDESAPKSSLKVFDLLQQTIKTEKPQAREGKPTVSVAAHQPDEALRSPQIETPKQTVPVVRESRKEESRRERQTSPH